MPEPDLDPEYAEIRYMDDRKRLLLILSIFPLTLLILFIFRGAVREWIVVPLISLIAFINQAILGIYQGILWVFFLTAFAMFSYYSLRKFHEYKEQYRDDRRKVVETGRVKYWSNLVNLARRGSVSLPYISSRLREQLFILIAYRQNLKPAEVEQRVLSGELEIPEDVRQFLYTQDRRLENHNSLAEILKFRRIFLFAQQRTDREQMMRNIERTIAYMEEIMEINNGNANR